MAQNGTCTQQAQVAEMVQQYTIGEPISKPHVQCFCTPGYKNIKSIVTKFSLISLHNWYLIGFSG